MQKVLSKADLPQSNVRAFTLLVLPVEGQPMQPLCLCHGSPQGLTHHYLI